MKTTAVGNPGKLLLVGAVLALAAALTVILLDRSGSGTRTANADSAAAPLDAPVTAGFVKFDGVDGEATDSRHSTWSDVLIFNYSMNGIIYRDGSEVRVRSRGSQVQDISVTKYIDKSSTKIQEYALTGEEIPSIDFEMTTLIPSDTTRANEQTYIAYKLTGAIITNYRTGGPVSGSDRMTETFTLAYNRISVTYTPHDSTGKATTPVTTVFDVNQDAIISKTIEK